MATNFPGSLDSYSTKASAETIAEGHINDPQDAIEAIEAKVGTGASTPIEARVLAGNGTGTTAWEQVNLTDAVTGVLPHANGGSATTGDSIVKGWVSINCATPVIRDSYNVASITDEGTGDFTVVWDVDFADINYALAGMSTDSCIVHVSSSVAGPVAASARLIARAQPSGNATDVDHLMAIAIGDR